MLFLEQIVTDKLKTGRSECTECSSKYTDFLNAVKSQKALAASIEQKLHNNSDEAVDAEDMAAEMDVSVSAVLPILQCPSIN